MVEEVTRNKMLILGTGAQKSATTWLYEYLVSSHNFSRPAMKEYHIWDALSIPCCNGFLMRGRSAVSEIDQIRQYLQSDTERYFEHFASILANQEGKTSCDITPSYAGLSRDVFRKIKEGLTNVGIDCRVVFFIRDPVERCWSAIRMRLSKGQNKNILSDDEIIAEATSVGYEMRTCYDKTITELEAVFEPNSIFIGVYEKLRDIEQLKSLSEFCRVDYRPSEVNRYVYVNKISDPLNRSAAFKIARHYEYVYKYASQRLPGIESVWSGFKYF